MEGKENQLSNAKQDGRKIKEVMHCILFFCPAVLQCLLLCGFSSLAIVIPFFSGVFAISSTLLLIKSNNTKLKTCIKFGLINKSTSLLNAMIHLE